jgi:succinoglycan biosynthesis transport protein ExoP
MVTNETHPTALRNGNGHYPPPPTYVAPTISPVIEEEEDDLDLSQLLTVARRRWPILLGVSVAVTLAVGIKLLTEEPIYQGEFDLLLGSVTGEQAIPEELQALQDPLNQKDQEDFETRVEVLKSAQVLAPILEEIQSRYPDLNYRDLVDSNKAPDKLAVNRLKETQILTVSYKSADPKEIEYVLSQLAEGYLSFSLDEQQFSSQQGLQFVKQQLPELRNRVDVLQGQLQQFRQQYNLIDPEAQGKLVSENLNELVDERQQAQVALGETQARYQTLSQQLGLDLNQAVAISALSEAPRYQQLLNELKEVETEIAQEVTRFNPNSPTIVALQERRQNLIPLLNQEATAVLGSNPVLGTNTVLSASPNEIRLELTQDLIEATNTLLALNVRQQALGAAEGQMRQQVQQMATVIRQYTDLQRELEVATASLDRFLSVREELEIEEAQQKQPWQVISEIRVPDDPVSPALPRDIILGALAGVIVGAGAALLVEKLDNTFHSPEELKDATGLPLLGLIPFIKDLQEGDNAKGNTMLSFGRYRASMVTEAFRSLHTNLYFMSPDNPIKSIVITSSIPSEGKSTISANLARTAAAMGQRVLLIDADLRKPKVHIRMDVPNVWGLSNIVSTDMNADDVIQKSPHEENLYILTAGQIPPDPTSLIASQKMKSLMQKFQDSFDLVIFDTPPTLGMADAKVIGANTDGMLMVVGLSKTERSAIKSTLDGIRLSPAKLLGIVGNGVKSHSQSSYSYYYQSYYTK